MKEAEVWIKNLALQPHPEGGFYRESYRSPGLIPPDCLSAGFEGPRNFSTSIYYLIRSGEKSHLHRLKSDETWYFHTGSSITLMLLSDKGLGRITLGLRVSIGQKLQFVVPANTWFGAFIPDPESFALCSCSVAPGFDFNDFEMGSRGDLMSRFPGNRSEIEMLTRI